MVANVADCTLFLFVADLASGSAAAELALAQSLIEQTEVMMRQQNVVLMAIALVVMTVCVDGAMSAPTVYEPFDYAAGAIDGTSQAGGVGMSGAWTTSTADSGVLYAMVGGALSFTNLPTTGAVRAKRPSAPKGAEMHRAISPASQTALTASARTMWFSVLVKNERYSVGNENGTFVFGSDALAAGTTDGTLPTITAGEGIGVHLSGSGGGGTIDIFAYTIDEGVAAKSIGKIDNTNTTVNTFLVAGKVEWAPNGSDDSLWLFNVSDPLSEEPAEATAFATVTADLDQSQFDTLGMANRQISSVDEIRFGLSFEETMGREPLRGSVMIVK